MKDTTNHRFDESTKSLIEIALMTVSRLKGSSPKDWEYLTSQNINMQDALRTLDQARDFIVESD